MGRYKSNNTTPCVNDWMQSSDNLIRSGKDNPMKDLDRSIEMLPNHSISEPGLVHPLTTSLVKLRDNGMIDVFVSTNQGIRIDPKTKSIMLFTNNTNIRTTDYRAWVENHSITNVRKNFKVNAESEINLNAKKDMNLKTDKNMTMTIHDKWTVNVVGDANINTNGNLNVNAGKNMSFKSGGDITFDGRTYNWR